jgi:signal peptide peptidase SppA
MSSGGEEVVAATSKPARGLMSRFVRRAGNTAKSGLMVVGFATVAGLYMEYKRLNPPVEDDESKEKKKQVLVIPFHRIQLVEQKDASFRGFLSKLDREEDDADTVAQYEVRELVDLLHHAASDPSIKAVYGIFGHGGMGIEQAGWAQVEEVRNALQVIKESHRRHPEPNVTHEMQVIPRVQSKPLYAYTDSFASLISPSNKDYYLASIFTHIHMQERGELNLFGMISQQFFIRDLLEKYGIQLHVFKHGQFKNAPNMFTHNTFNRFHYENVANILKAINDDVCQDITRSRSKALLTSWLTKKHKGDDNVTLWKRIHESGTFPAETAWKAGLVDFLPRRDPLHDLVDSNGGDSGDSEADETKEGVVAKWKPQETDFERFKASSAVTLKDYAKQVAKKKQIVQRRQSWHEYAAKNSTMERVLSAIGFTEKKDDEAKPKEHIALLQVNGTIGDSTASKVVSAIRKIRKDDKVKCVVVRVSSPGGSILACETIQQELKSLNLPLVFSFGNVAASGGYYIASSADRIFCSKKTITGSIGVFGIRMDLTGLASQYGINVEHVAAGDLSGSYMPFHPMSRKMRTNMAGQIDRYYAQFKKLVADGRNMPEDSVEAIAQGRVWTGDQAKSNGLIDEVGGLHRAIAYARRTYTSNEDVDGTDVVVWPKKKTLLERFLEAKEKSDAVQAFTVLFDWAMGQDMAGEDSVERQQNSMGVAGGMVDWMLRSPNGIPGTLSGVLMTSDENAAIRCLLENAKAKQQSQQTVLPESFWD